MLPGLAAGRAGRQQGRGAAASPAGAASAAMTVRPRRPLLIMNLGRPGPATVPRVPRGRHCPGMTPARPLVLRAWAQSRARPARPGPESWPGAVDPADLVRRDRRTPPRQAEEAVMAQYLILIYENESRYSDASPEVWDEVMQAHGRFPGQVEQKGGKLLGGEALQPNSTATSIRGDIVTDGPFAETKEALGGYYLIDRAEGAGGAVPHRQQGRPARQRPHRDPAPPDLRRPSRRLQPRSGGSCWPTRSDSARPSRPAWSGRRSPSAARPSAP